MAKNLMPEVARMLGVKVGEKFKIKGHEGLTYRFNDDELIFNDDNNAKIYIASSVTFTGLLNGKVEIIKLPWKPKEGTEVYTFSFTTHEYNSRFCPHKGVWYVTKWNWAGFPWQIAALDKGWVFPTREEAEAALPAVAAEIGVEYKL